MGENSIGGCIRILISKYFVRGLIKIFPNASRDEEEGKREEEEKEETEGGEKKEEKEQGKGERKWERGDTLGEGEELNS